MPQTDHLLFITSTRIGDAVLGSALLAHMLAEMPGCAVTVAGGRLVEPLFAGVPGLVRFIPMVKRPWAGHWRDLWRQTVGQRWHTILDLRGSLVGYGLRHRRLIRWSGSGSGGGHQVERLGRLLNLSPPPSPCLFPDARQRQAGAAALPADRPILALGPTANGRGKEWAPERFAALARWVTGPDGPLPGAAVALFGAPDDRARMEPLRQGLAGLPVIEAFNLGDLGIVGQALARCQLYIGNDSGLMHIAAASGVPTFGLFGVSPMERYGPWGARAGAVSAPLTPQEAMARYHQSGVWPMDWLSEEAVRAGVAEFWERL